MPPALPHSWRFSRIGGLDQVRLETAEDLRQLGSLDQKLWTALACPVRGLDLDERTLALIDGDGDGRIRQPELVAAVNWACQRLRDPALILEPGDSLPLNALAQDCEAGKAIAASARRILEGLEKPEATAISTADTADTLRIVTNLRFNGDGVITAEAAEDETLAALIAEAVTATGGSPDRSGPLGINGDQLTAFWEALTAYAAWWADGEANSTGGSGVLPLGEATPTAAAAIDAVAAKVDDYFARCRLAAYQADAVQALAGTPDWKLISARNLAELGPEIADLPLQAPAPGRALDLTATSNPAWSAAVTTLYEQAVKPLLGDKQQSLGWSDWVALRQRLTPYRTWSAAKAGLIVEGLGIARVREILAADRKADLEALIAQDLTVAPEIDGIVDVDRLLRYRRDLGRLLRNFLNFSEFLDPGSLALFQAGRLYIDQRSCHLVLQVDDPGKHTPFAGLARVCVIYCSCTRPGSAPIIIAAAVTGGDMTQLMVGRNGIYFDRQGRDWDATVTKIAEAPISVRQAAWTPYRKFAGFVESQVEKFAASKEASATDMLSKGATSAAEQAQTPPATKPPPFDIARFAGIFAALGLALGAIGGAIGSMLAAFATLAWWQIPLAILGILIAISGPSMLIAVLKLRQRTLGPLLEGTGWAINGRVKITFRLGRILTQLKRLPPGSRRSGIDPFASTSPWPGIVIAVILIAAIAIGWWWWSRPVEEVVSESSTTTETVTTEEGTTTTTTVEE